VAVGNTVITVSTVNPLVAAGLDGPKDDWSGVWIAEDIELIAQGVRNGSWIDGSLGVVGAGLDALAIISDPVGALLQYGVAWIIEHVKPLSEALDWLAGDPGQIAAHAQTWRNVAGDLRADADDLIRAARLDIAEWTGAAAEAYRKWSAEQGQSIDALAQAAETMAAITEGAGFLIAAVRTLVRDAIATVVSRLIVYAAEVAGSLGLATPLVVEQVSTLVASWAAKIARWLKSLIGSLRALAAQSQQLEHLIEALRKILARLRGGRDGRTDVPERRELNRVRKRGSGPPQRMTMESVDRIAAKYGIDISGIPLEINVVRAGICGITRSNRSVELCRAAFRSEEDLARTLEHERFHVEELRQGQPYPTTERGLDAFEDRAEAHEDAWWDSHSIRPEGSR
jgi:uncharacterized protein YukE